MISYTDIKTYLRCPSRYWYSRLEAGTGIEQIQKGWRLSLGSWVAAMKEAYRSGQYWEVAWAELKEQWDEEVVPFTSDPEILGVPSLARQIMKRYLETWGAEDSNFTFLHVEQSFEYKGVGITPDAVVKDNRTGNIWVIEDKVTMSIPEEADMMADLQGLLYVGAMRELYGYDVVGIIRDFSRSRLPTQPRVNKTIKKELGHPDISNVKRIDTDYDTLATFAATEGIPPYPDLVARLAELEDRDPFFQRQALLIPDEAVISAWDDAEHIRMDIETLSTDPDRRMFPRHVLPPSAGVASCRGCPFRKVCEADLFAVGEDAARMEYRERIPLDRDYKDVYAEE